MSTVLFFIAAIGAIAGAVGVITLENPFYSVLALVSHLISLAALFLLLRAEFVAAAQVVVYAGAVMVLYTFVVSYVGGADGPARAGDPLGRPPGATMTAVAWACGGALVIELFIAVLGSGLKAVSTHGAAYGANFGSPQAIGDLLLTRFLAPFEIASYLLLIAAVGAVVLARRRGGVDDDDGTGVPVITAMDIFRPRPQGTGTMAEGVGGRVRVAGVAGQIPTVEPAEPALVAQAAGVARRTGVGETAGLPSDAGGVTSESVDEGEA